MGNVRVAASQSPSTAAMANGRVLAHCGFVWNDVIGSAPGARSRAAPEIVQRFTNALEWRCLERIRAIQELCVAYLPD